MKKYLRFGEIPKDEKSINFLKMSNQQKDDFSWAMNTFGIDEALNEVPEKSFRAGSLRF